VAVTAAVASLVSVAAPIETGTAEAATYTIGRIRPMHNQNLCLDLPNPSGVWNPAPPIPPSGTKVAVHACHGNPNQQWKVVELAKEVVQVRSVWSNQCLEIPSDSQANGLEYRVATCATPSTSVQRQTFAVIQNGTLTSTSGKVQLRSNIAGSGGLKACMEVPASGGAGTQVKQYTCDATSVGQTNQLWRFDTFYASELNSAHDGQVAPVNSSPNTVGMFTRNGSQACSGTSVVGASRPGVVVTAAHCVEAYQTSGDVWFYPGRDDRRTPKWVGAFHVDQIHLVPGRDQAILITGGMYNPDWSWNGKSLSAAVGQQPLRFSAIGQNIVTYTYGYPDNIGNRIQPVACANPTETSQMNKVTCQGTQGISGSGWRQWGTQEVHAVSASTVWTTYSTLIGGTTRVNDIQIDNFTPGTQTQWQAVS
jgi:hypothetical protein